MASLVQSNASVVPEAGRWSVFIPRLPVAAAGATVDEAIAEMVDALREYVDDWQDHLFDSPNHIANRGLVELIALSDDEQLKSWLVGERRNWTEGH